MTTANNDLTMIENELNKLLPTGECSEKLVVDAMKYSLDAGGKRVRPRLVLEFCRLCGGEGERALHFACAVEMIHTYSLIHDDLPCMDDDDLRRGKPSNHKMFGEAFALLAGDALLTMAFEVINSDEAASLLGDRACRLAAKTLAEYAGAHGMIGGQVIDLQNENTDVSVEALREMDAKKTGFLIKAACELGCIAAGADEEKIKAAREYGECVGLAFQIQDDILDIISSDEELGKPVGSDRENKKSTYVSLLGVEKCVELVDELTEKATASLAAFDGDSQSLAELARSLAKRKN